MPRKRKYGRVPIAEIRRILKRTTLDASPPIKCNGAIDRDGVSDLSVISRRLIGLSDQTERKSKNMLFFIMYDIESNKVRTQVAKYLLHAGCLRIQKSIFLADLPFETMDKIMMDLTEVQACYDNQDSVIVVPIPSDYLQAMKVIGKSIDLNLIMKTKNTIFF